MDIAEVAAKVRAEFEDYHDGDLTALNDCCHSMSQALYDALVRAGYSPSRVVGQYLGADDDFHPNMDEWEQSDIDDFDRDAGFNHWWVEVDGKLVDICADQFHPGSRSEHRVVVLSLPAPDYESQIDQPEPRDHAGHGCS